MSIADSLLFFISFQLIRLIKRKILRVKMTFNRVNYILLQFLKSFAFGEYREIQSFGNKSALSGIFNAEYNFVHHFPLKYLTHFNFVFKRKIIFWIKF